MVIIKILLILIPALVSVAFLTLLERKLMSGIQRRIGPNVVGIFGLLQPFADGLKIALKDTIIGRKVHFFLFVLGPIFNFILSLLAWAFLPFGNHIVFFETELSLLLFLAISSLNIYGVLLATWASNSKYAMLGGLRAVSQMVAYELSFGLVVSILALITSSFRISDIVIYQENSLWFCFLCLPCFLIFFISILAETYRVPFDLPEAEGEIVAGVHVEYSSLPFALFYLAEYSNLIVMSGFGVSLFLGGYSIPKFLVSFFFVNIVFVEFFFFSLKICFFLYIIVALRASLPRLKYEQLLDLGWRILLPLTIGFFLLYAGFITL